jgi:UDPglucose--hexose-1-phosphate uridylyltransferase
MGIRFEKYVESIEFHSPLKCGDLVEHIIERRRDPLTGRIAIGSRALLGKGEFFFGPTDRELIEKIASDTRTNCLFCPEYVERSTPRYREDWLPGGALRKGECFLFPNLFPLSAVHAVVVLGEKHYRDLNDFPADLLRDGLVVSLDFIRALSGNVPENVHFTVNANYLFPAGASMVHPHLQIFGGRYPATAVSELTDACRRYREKNGEDYFEQLVKEEMQLGQRYIRMLGPVHWLTPFAPVGTNEVLGILPDCPNLLRLDDAAVAGLAEGISTVLAYYGERGFSTFNFTLYSGPLNDNSSLATVFIRILCRQNVRKYYRADDYFIQKLLGEELILTTPEDLAADLRDFWK